MDAVLQARADLDFNKRWYAEEVTICGYDWNGPSNRDDWNGLEMVVELAGLDEEKLRGELWWKNWFKDQKMWVQDQKMTWKDWPDLKQRLDLVAFERKLGIKEAVKEY